MKNKIVKKGFATRQIHSASMEIPGINPLVMPIFQTSTFAFESSAQGAARFLGEEAGYIYSRLANPNSDQVAKTVADLENAEDGLALSSGVGAITTCLFTLLHEGDHILADETLYSATFSLLRDVFKKYGIQASFTDFSDVEKIRNGIQPNTKAVYFETPANPNLRILDIEAIAAIAHQKKQDVQVITDNTFASPYLQRPIDWGVDTVLHSGTKYLNGHGDVISGFICGRKDFIEVCRSSGLKLITGAVPSPFDCFLINRGLKTLDIRMEKHCHNAQQIAEFLQSHPKVAKVYYPGLRNFEGFEIAQKQMKLPGGMVSFELKASREQTAKFVDNLELCTRAVSLGDAETLIEHPASMSHVGLDQQALALAHISESLLRLSVGLEDAQDLIDDLINGLGSI